jgi:hypothetical protein
LKDFSSFPKGLNLGIYRFPQKPLNFLHPYVSLSLLSPNTCLITLFPKTLSICSLNATDPVLHPCIAKGKITALHILISMFLTANGKTEDFYINDSKYSPYLSCSEFLHQHNLYLLLPFPDI